MIDFESLDELKDAFVTGKYNMEKEFTLKGVEFSLATSSTMPFDDIIHKNVKEYLIYTTRGPKRKQAAKDVGLLEWVVFLWAFENSTNRVIPYTIKNTSHHRLNHDIVHEADEPDPKIIGDSVEVKFTSLSNSPTLRGKVDTGAELSSLHADKWKVDRGTGKVSFVNKDLSPNTITVPLDDHQPIRSADGGTEYRPIIRLNVKINDKLFTDVAFNLNDRSNMNMAILIGQNLLEKGKFLIDPLKEEEDIKDVNELIEEWDNEVVAFEPSETLIDKEAVDALYAMLRDSDVSFSDIIKIVRTKALEESSEITY